VPFIRPKNISGDYSKTMEVIEHAVNFLNDNLNETYDLIVLLEPTSPLRTSEDIDNSLEKLISTPGATSLVSIGKEEAQDSTLQFKLLDDNFIKLSKEKTVFNHYRRQDIPAKFFLDGNIYISRIDTLLDKKTFVHEQTTTIQLPKWKTIEVDDEYDYQMALALGRLYLS
jgi:CMP-N-acetylneuraminic acid synthetase